MTQQPVRTDSEYVANLLNNTMAQRPASEPVMAAITEGLKRFAARHDLQGKIDREILRLYVECRKDSARRLANRPDDIAAPAATDGRAPQKFIICTDGSCIGNPGQGGWAYVVTTPDGEPVAQQSGHCQQTTNSRMELTAVAEALEYTAEQKGAVTIRSDSKYVVDAFNKEWIPNWQRNGWRTASKQPVKNQDLWQRILQAIASHDAEVKFEWVKGHAGHQGNEMADRMANAAARNA